MIVALAVWDERIAPVFDVARQLVVLSLEDGVAHKQEQVRLSEGLTGQQRALVIEEIGTQKLVCGAISRTLSALIEAMGIEVISFISGSLGEVERALLDSNFNWEKLAMPGCYGTKVEADMENPDKAMNQRGAGRAGGRGSAVCRRGAGTSGSCVCPQCGEKVPHQRGRPCFEVNCSKCGTAMAREF
ncbi:MAG: hypothetical protein K9K75_01255 [Deltaproteobacteria bacterium]|nr:hypothetical protein [Deltaproteobacteria bacterium]